MEMNILLIPVWGILMNTVQGKAKNTSVLSNFTHCAHFKGIFIHYYTYRNEIN